MTYMSTISGGSFDFANLKSNKLNTIDMIHSLYFQNRFNGHTKCVYTVADHTILLTRECSDYADRNSFDVDARRNLMRMAMVHDCHEAYISDVVSPLKQMLGDKFLYLDQEIEKLVREHFRVNPAHMHWSLIKDRDLALVWAEKDAYLSKKIDREWGIPKPENGKANVFLPPAPQNPDFGFRLHSWKEWLGMWEMNFPELFCSEWLDFEYL